MSLFQQLKRKSIAKLFSRVQFLDRSTELFFGECIGALSSGSAPNSKAARFLSAFDAAMRGMRERKELGPLYFIRGTDKKWKDACSQVQSFVDEHIRKAMERKNAASKSETDENSLIFVDTLLHELGDPLSVRSQLLNIFQAARDSTAISLSNVFFHLARHRHVWSKLRGEALNVSGPLSFELFKFMTYLQHVLKESQCPAALRCLVLKTDHVVQACGSQAQQG